MKRPVIFSLLTLIVICCAGFGLLSIAGGTVFTRLPAPANTPVALVVPQLPTLAAAENLPPDVTSQMDAIQNQVIQIRRLIPTHALQRATLSNSQLHDQVIQNFLKDYTREKSTDDVVELSLLGLLNPGFDLYDLYINLYSEQVAGYYDPQTKEMFVVQGNQFGGLERMNYAHEFTHALQDQVYDLRDGLKFKDEYCNQNAEYCNGVDALIEGDATFTEQLWFIEDSTQNDRLQVQDFYGSYKSPVFDSAPAYLKKSFLFPYKQGMEFVQSLYDQGGYAAIDAAFQRPPADTEQVLHPDLYPADQPENVSLPDFLPVLNAHSQGGQGAQGALWRETDHNMLGEWQTYLVLSSGANVKYQLPDSQARSASAGWGGDAMVVYRQDATQAGALVLKSSWDTPKDAGEFWRALQEYSQKRWGAPSHSTSAQVTWATTPNGAVVTAQNGSDTLLLIAPDMDTASNLLDKLAEFKG
jgi:hypothetical protein